MYFRYKAIDTVGQKQRGTLTAESEASAASELRDRGLTLTSIVSAREKAKAKSVWEIEVLEPDVHEIKLRKKQLVLFARKAAIMMKAGVPLSDAFDVIIDSEKNRRARKVYTEVAKGLYLGEKLSASMRKFKAFPEVMVSIIESGEANGGLDWSFRKIADMLEREASLGAKVTGALFYPVFLIILVIGLVVVMNVLIIPQFSKMFESFGADLPGITVAVMGVSHFLVKYGLIILAAAGIIILAFVLLKKYNESFHLRLSKTLLNIPLIGTLIKHSSTASFCRVVATLLESGVEVVEALRSSVKVVNNYYVRKSISSIADRVTLGSTLYAAIDNLNFFDSLFISMLKVGESSSLLGETMGKLADMYEEQTEQTTKRLTSLMEPMMTLVIGIVIAVIVAAIIVPMFSMYSAVSNI